jgi:hypothetical protein
MLPKKPHLFDLIVKAADLRARGVSWAAVAAKVGRKVMTVEEWPKRFPEVWKQAFAEARVASASETASEGGAVLRLLLRSQDEKIKRDAVRLSLEFEARALARTQPAAERDDEDTPDSEAVRIVRYAQGMSHDEIRALLREVVAEEGSAPSGSGVPDGKGPGSQS